VEKNETARPPHRDWHGTHHRWIYRPQAFRWNGEQIAGINFVPIASELRAWLRQEGQLQILTKAHQQETGAYTNPYAYSSVALALALGRVVNAFHAYANTQSPGETDVDAEIERLRLYNEVMLYAARFSEAAIKQLLYCSVVPESSYQRMALGALLESPCKSCKKKDGKKPHSISWLGTLAHPFHLCLQFDHCAMDHMNFVNNLRNTRAAHSEIETLDVRTIQESKNQLLRDSTEVLNGFVHMLSHLEELEQAMLEDLAQKGLAINRLKLNGLPPEDCNFHLVPGRPFVFQPKDASGR
jgi:hypothetical protein